MNSLTKIMVSPHIHSGKSTTGIMRDVLISLIPATVAGILIFGLRALLVIAVCVLSSVAFEAVFNIIVKKQQTIGDLSAAVTGLLLALNLPADIPVWQYRSEFSKPCHYRTCIYVGGFYINCYPLFSR